MEPTHSGQPGFDYRWTSSLAPTLALPVDLAATLCRARVDFCTSHQSSLVIHTNLTQSLLYSLRLPPTHVLLEFRVLTVIGPIGNAAQGKQGSVISGEWPQVLWFATRGKSWAF